MSTENSKLAGKCILLCEDHPINAQIVKGLLENQDMTVHIAQDGLVGVQMFEASQCGGYAAVLMDINMPVLNGFDAARSIRTLERADAARVPIIAMTADISQQQRDKVLDAGMNGFSPKPVVPMELLELLERLIDRSQG